MWVSHSPVPGTLWMGVVVGREHRSVEEEGIGQGGLD